MLLLAMDEWICIKTAQMARTVILVNEPLSSIDAPLFSALTSVRTIVPFYDQHLDRDKPQQLPDTG